MADDGALVVVNDAKSAEAAGQVVADARWLTGQTIHADGGLVL